MFYRRVLVIPYASCNWFKGFHRVIYTILHYMPLKTKYAYNVSQTCNELIIIMGHNYIGICTCFSRCGLNSKWERKR